jgi:hypothetical protein
MELCSWAYNSEDEAERPPTVPAVHGAALVGTPQNSPILQGSAGPLECNIHWFGTTTTPTTTTAAAADAAAKTTDVAAAAAAKTTEAAVAAPSEAVPTAPTNAAAAPSEAVPTAPTNAAAAVEAARATIAHDALRGSHNSILRSVQYSRPDIHPKLGVGVRFGTTRKPTSEPVTQNATRTEIGSVRPQLVWRAPAALRTPAHVTPQRAPEKPPSPGTGAVDRDDLAPTVQLQHPGTSETPPKPRCARNWLAAAAGWYVKVAVFVFSLDLAVGALDCTGVLLLG